MSMFSGVAIGATAGGVIAGSTMMKTAGGTGVALGLGYDVLKGRSFGESITQGFASGKKMINKAEREGDRILGQQQKLFSSMEERGGVVGAVGKTGEELTRIQRQAFGLGADVATKAWGLMQSAWGKTSYRIWDNSKAIAQTREKESQKYQIVQKSIGQIVDDLGISQLSKASEFLQQKGEEENTVTQTIRKKKTSWGGAKKKVSYSYRYWQESTDQLLGRYGFETYAQKIENLRETLDWMEVKDMDKLESDVYMVDIKDVEGQQIERDIAGSRMRDYFGSQYVEAERV